MTHKFGEFFQFLFNFPTQCAVLVFELIAPKHCKRQALVDTQAQYMILSQIIIWLMIISFKRSQKTHSKQ